MFVLPLQNAPQKFFTPQISTRYALIFAKPFFNRGLGSDASMVHTRQPKHFEAMHTRAARENILDCVVENVAERQHTGDVRRRHYDRERWLRRSGIGCETALRQPARIPLFFSGLRSVSL